MLLAVIRPLHSWYRSRTHSLLIHSDPLRHVWRYGRLARNILRGPNMVNTVNYAHIPKLTQPYTAGCSRTMRRSLQPVRTLLSPRQYFTLSGYQPNVHAYVLGLWVADWTQTLPMEIDTVWFSKTTGPKILFFVNRYGFWISSGLGIIYTVPAFMANKRHATLLIMYLYRLTNYSSPHMI